MSALPKARESKGDAPEQTELAEALGLGYAFANFHLVLSQGDRGEQDVEQGTPNDTAPLKAVEDPVRFDRSGRALAHLLTLSQVSASSAGA